MILFWIIWLLTWLFGMLWVTVSSITPSIDGVAGLVGTQELFPFFLTIHLDIWTIGVYVIQKDDLKHLP